MTAENNTPDPGASDTIVLIHGLWVTPRSWEHWIERYEGRGYHVLAPAYPGLEAEVETLNENPSPIEALTVPAVVEHYEGRRRVGAPADHHGPLLRRSAHPDLARPRVRRRRGGYRLRARRGHQGRSSLADQG